MMKERRETGEPESGDRGSLRGVSVVYELRKLL